MGLWVVLLILVSRTERHLIGMVELTSLTPGHALHLVWTHGGSRANEYGVHHLLTAKELLWSLISSSNDNSNNANENADKDQYDAYGGDNVHAEKGLTGEWLVIDPGSVFLEENVWN